MAVRASRVPRRSGSAGGRTARLIGGVFLGAVGYALTIRADLGLGPWHVLQQGISRHADITIGTAAIGVNALMLVAALVLRERPGVGTVVVTVLGGLFLDAVLPFFDEPAASLPRFAMVLSGLAVMSFGGALYLSAVLGAAPLDAVMTGIYRWTRFSLHNSRLGLEVLGLGLGWWAGGTVGAGSVVIGLGIGPALHAWLHLLGAVPDRTDP